MATTHFSGPLAVGPEQIEVLAAAKTLTREDSGKTFAITGTGYAVTLPAVSVAGAHYRFVVRATFSTDVVITAATAVINGMVDANSTLVLAASESVITIEDGAETIGDWYELRSDGTIWYVTGQTSAGSTVTFTAP